MSSRSVASNRPRSQDFLDGVGVEDRLEHVLHAEPVRETFLLGLGGKLYLPGHHQSLDPDQCIHDARPYAQLTLATMPVRAGSRRLLPRRAKPRRASTAPGRSQPRRLRRAVAAARNAPGRWQESLGWLRQPPPRRGRGGGGQPETGTPRSPGWRRTRRTGAGGQVATADATTRA